MVQRIVNMEEGDSYQGPGLYRHHQGGLYVVEGLGLEEADLAPYVVYRSRRPHSMLTGSIVTWWLRKYDVFNEEVHGRPRFQYLGAGAHG